MPPRTPNDIRARGFAPRPASGGSSQGAPARATPMSEKAGLARQIFPPWLYPLRQGSDFFIFTIGGAKSAALAAGAGSTLVSDPFRLPKDTSAVIRLVSIFANLPTGAIDVEWTLRINKVPVQGWTFTTYPRVANNLSIEFGGIVRVAPNSTIDVLITNKSAAGPWTVGTQFGGWYWNNVAAEQTFGIDY